MQVKYLITIITIKIVDHRGLKRKACCVKIDATWLIVKMLKIQITFKEIIWILIIDLHYEYTFVYVSACECVPSDTKFASKTVFTSALMWHPVRCSPWDTYTPECRHSYSLKVSNMILDYNVRQTLLRCMLVSVRSSDCVAFESVEFIDRLPDL